MSKYLLVLGILVVLILATSRCTLNSNLLDIKIGCGFKNEPCQFIFHVKENP